MKAVSHAIHNYINYCNEGYKLRDSQLDIIVMKDMGRVIHNSRNHYRNKVNL